TAILGLEQPSLLRFIRLFVTREMSHAPSFMESRAPSCARDEQFSSRSAWHSSGHRVGDVGFSNFHFTFGASQDRSRFARLQLHLLFSKLLLNAVSPLCLAMTSTKLRAAPKLPLRIDVVARSNAEYRNSSISAAA